jgi:hypothetical protein
MLREFCGRPRRTLSHLVLDLLVTPGRRTSEERARGLRPQQMQWAAIFGDRVLEPHFAIFFFGRTPDHRGDRGAIHVGLRARRT